MATNFAVKIDRWKAPKKEEDPYLSEPQSPAMKRVMLELSAQSTLAAEEAQRQVAAQAAAAVVEAPPPPSPAQLEEARKQREREEFRKAVERDIALEAAKAQPGPPVVWRLASELEAEAKAREELAAREAAEAQAQVAEFDEIAEPPAPPASPAPGAVMYSDPLV